MANEVNLGMIRKVSTKAFKRSTAEVRSDGRG